MAREFKPVRFFVMMAVAAFVVCGVTAFYTHRAAHGRTPEERAAGGVRRVWRDGVLYSSRGSRQNTRGASGLCHRGESGRASTGWGKVADGC